MANDGALWHRDAAARSLILRRYLPWLAGLSLAWEIAQLPLYTIWNDGRPVYIAFAVLHCTAGDVLIGLAALAIALIITPAPVLAAWRWRRLALVTAAIATSYTPFREWMNTVALRSLGDSEGVPRGPLGHS